MKILIIQTAFIGDVILATSLIEAVKQYYPEAQLDFLLRRGNESLLENSPHITQVYIWEKKKAKTRSLIKNLFQIRHEKYDLVLNIQRFANSGLLTAFSGAKVKIGFDKNPLSFLFSKKVTHLIPHKVNDKSLHEVQRNLQLLKAFNSKIELNIIRPQLYFSQREEKRIDELKLKKPYLVMAPSSVWYTKQWHIDKWRELISLVNEKYTVYLIGAPSDQAYTRDLEVDNVINLCGKLTLLESALLMKKAERVFVNDSAPLHLASSVNAKTTAIFCSTIPEFGYFPISEDSKLIQLEPRLACMPCGLHGKSACPLGHFQCSSEIHPLDVANTI